MTTISQALQVGVACHQAGLLPEAEAAYRQVLRDHPQLAQALNNLGTILQVQGRLDEAFECYERAIAAKPNYADAHNNLGTAWQDRKDWKRAAECYRRATEVSPSYARGFYNLGVALCVQDLLAGAREAFERAAAIDPDYADAHHGLATILQKEKKFAEAEAQYRRVLKQWPQLAGAWVNLGTLCQAQQRTQEAIECYRQAVAIMPQYAQAHYNLGVAAQELDRLEEAASAYRAAIGIDPHDGLAHNNLARVYEMQGNLADARESYRSSAACYRRAIGLQPADCQAYSMLGSALFRLGQIGEAQECYESWARQAPLDPQAHFFRARALHKQNRLSEAIAAYEQVLSLDPDSADAHYHCGLARLAAGDFARGWAEFEWRRKTEFAGRAYRQERWNGEDPNAQRILLHAEWGLGDTLQFVRYAPLVARRGGDVVLAVQPPLIPLLRESGFRQIVPWDEENLPDCRWQAPLMSLPLIFGTTLESVPTGIPYLRANAELVDYWRKRLLEWPGFKVGIFWQGFVRSVEDQRGIRLAEFAPLARSGPLTLISLARHEPADVDRAADAPMPVVDFGAELDKDRGAFMDTAALLSQLDLVITCDSSLAHLAGAMGVPVWVAHFVSAEWRWLVGRQDSPWYPTMRLFRQSRVGDWSDVFARMAAQLSTLVQARSTQTASAALEPQSPR